ncbi:MAG: hypothetical protein JOY81_07170 [Alphaproteobacteria bacterium]|nr:hypothetical protein [Alphaproteobacteria bacterium]
MTDTNDLPPSPDPSLPPLEAIELPPERLPTIMLVLLGIAGVFYALMMSSILPDPNAAQPGRVDQTMAAFAGLLLWLLLGLLLLVGAVQGKMPIWGLAFVVLLPLSAFASAVAVGLSHNEPDWPLIVPGFVPLLVAFYATWARLPQIQEQLRPPKTTLVVCLAVLALSVAPLVAQVAAPDARQVAAAAAERQALARKQAELDAAAAANAKPAPKAPSGQGFERLGPTSSLADYLPYLNGPYATAARKDARLVKTRQADAVTLLKQGHLGALSHLLEFNVEPTSELCQAYGEALAAAAKTLDPKTNPENYVADAMALQEQVPNMQWLTGAHCTLDQPLSILELNVRLIAEPRLAGFADLLAKLRKAR